MTAASFKRWVALLIPDAVLFGAALAALRVPAFQATLPAAARIFPTTVFAVGGLLAWRLERGRLFFALLVLAASAAVLRLPSAPEARGATDAVMVLLPLNLAVLALRADRGIFTRAGLVTFCALALEVVAVAVALHGAPTRTAAWLEHPIVATSWLGWLHVSQLAGLAFVVALVATATPLVFESSAVGRSFLWAILAALAAAWVRHPGPGAGILLGTAGFILVLVTVETSHRLAYQDALTGLPGRRALGEALQQLGSVFALAMVDVDHFKRFNDQYGHDAGDQILKMVATKLSHIGGEGRAFRYGGEEFAIVFPGASKDEALPHIEGVRRTIAETRFVVRRRLRRKRGAGKPPRSRPVAVSVTISAGVAERGGHSAPEDVLRTADRALYGAKEGGRNQVRG